MCLVFLNTVHGLRGKALDSAHDVMPKAWGRGTVAVLQAGIWGKVK